MKVKTANPNFFLVKISKKEQEHRKFVSDHILMSDSFSFGNSSLQKGEIIAIGAFAGFILPTAKVGGYLVFSWKVEYSGDTGKINEALVGEDENYKYYSVTISEYKGRMPETFGYFDELGFTTHPSYVILSKPKKELKETRLKSGIITFDNYRPSDDEIKQKIEFNKQHIYSLSITHASLSQTRESEARQTKELMQNLQDENEKLTKLLQGKEECEEYEIIYSNPLQNLKPFDKVFANNIFCREEIIINGNAFIIAPYKHVYAQKLIGLKIKKSLLVNP